ncbi:MAG: hypothetical protein ACYC5O_21330 [Anaerolineae bacterium]
MADHEPLERSDFPPEQPAERLPDEAAPDRTPEPVVAAVAPPATDPDSAFDEGGNGYHPVDAAGDLTADARADLPPDAEEAEPLELAAVPADAPAPDAGSIGDTAAQPDEAPSPVQAEALASTAALLPQGDRERTPPAAVPVAPRQTRGVSVLGALLLALLGSLLGAGIALLAVYLINGTLFFAARDDGLRLAAAVDAVTAEQAGLQNSVDTLTTRTGTAEARLDGIDAGLRGLGDDLAVLDGRLAEVEGMRDQVEQTLSQVQMLSGDVEIMRSSLDAAVADAQRFDQFLTDLRAILGDGGG